MKKLQDILYGVAIESIVGSTAIEVESIEFDSRKVKKEALFIAQKGVVTDGHEFISSGLRNGAVAFICEQLPEECKKGIVYVVVENASKALGQVAANYYDNPSQKLSLVGVTGTNGKYKVKDSKRGGYGTITAAKAFEVSSNVGLVKIVHDNYKENPKKFVDRLYNMGLNKNLFENDDGDDDINLFFGFDKEINRSFSYDWD